MGPVGECKQGGQVWMAQPGWGRGQLGEGIPKELHGGGRRVWVGSLRRAAHRVWKLRATQMPPEIRC